MEVTKEKKFSTHVGTTNSFHIPECRACIDTSEEGDLVAGVFLGEYTHTRDYLPLSQEDQLNISINVHDDGNTLEIVSLCCKYKKLIQRAPFKFISIIIRKGFLILFIVI